MNITYKISDSILKIEKYCKLYNKCFNQNKFHIRYLKWLYNENPTGNYIGIDCYDHDKLIGQVGGVPHEFYYNKKKLKFIISVNVCVDKNYRGQKLFSKMIKKFDVMIKKNNFDGLIAIGNKSATPGWLSAINLINLGELDAFLGWGEINDSNIDIKKYNFFSVWNNKKISWRLKNPNNNTYMNENDNNKIKPIYSLTKYFFLKAHAPLIFFDDEISLIKSNKDILKFFLFIGKIGKLKNKKIINIPTKFKPSPLNFLYKTYNKKINLDYEKVFFSFLDFDIF